MVGSDVIVLLRERPSAAQSAALEAQTRAAGPPVIATGSWRDAVAQANAADGPDWYWLIDPGVVPAPTALQAMGERLEAWPGGLPAPALLTSKVARPDGHLDPDRAPWPPLLDRQVVIAAARERLVSLRMARWGSLLVRREVALEHLPPDSGPDAAADDLGWTARILRDGHGYLVPASVVTREEPDTGLTPAEARGRARMVRGDTWVAQEPVWFAFMLGVDLVRAGRARPAGVPALLRGVARGARG